MFADVDHSYASLLFLHLANMQLKIALRSSAVTQMSVKK